MSIRFSGTAGQVRAPSTPRFTISMVNGKPHIANMSDPQIPAALATGSHRRQGAAQLLPAARAPHGQHGHARCRDRKMGAPCKSARRTLSRQASASPREQSLATAKPAAASPQFGISVGGTSPYLVEDVGPWDFATIYNVLPLVERGHAHRWHRADHRHRRHQRYRCRATAGNRETGANGNNDVPPSAPSSACPPATRPTRRCASPATASRSPSARYHRNAPYPAILRHRRSD